MSIFPLKVEAKDTMIISCAVSFADVLQKVVQEYTKDKDLEIRINLSSSGILAKQITKGAPVDFFLTASEKWMNYLKERDLIASSFETSIACNHLALVSSKNSTLKVKNLSTLTQNHVQKISIGDYHHVPAGSYALQALRKCNIYDQLQSKMIFTPNVRASLAHAEKGVVDCAFVYLSDAVVNDKVKVLYIIPDTYTDDIRYFGGLIKHHLEKQNISFYKYLVSDTAKGIYTKYGFSVCN